jgi:hypothetical protein
MLLGIDGVLALDEWELAIVLRSVDRSVRLGWLGVCPECQMAEVGKSWTISKSVQRSDG